MIKWILEKRYIPRIEWETHVSELKDIDGFLLGVVGVVIGYLICFLL